MAYCFDSTEDVWLYVMYHLEIFTMQRVFGTVDVLVMIMSKNHSLNNISVSHRTFLFLDATLAALAQILGRKLISILHQLLARSREWSCREIFSHSPSPLLLVIPIILDCYFSGTIRAVVGIMVLNKTSEEYWFLMQFNVSQVSGEVDIVDGSETIDFFLIRFHLDSG